MQNWKRCLNYMSLFLLYTDISLRLIDFDLLTVPYHERETMGLLLQRIYIYCIGDATMSLCLSLLRNIYCQAMRFNAEKM